MRNGFFLATRTVRCASRILFIKSMREKERECMERGLKLRLRFITTVMLGKDCYRRYLPVSITKMHALRSCARANVPRLTPSLLRIFRPLKLKACDFATLWCNARCSCLSIYMDHLFDQLLFLRYKSQILNKCMFLFWIFFYPIFDHVV